MSGNCVLPEAPAPQYRPPPRRLRSARETAELLPEGSMVPRRPNAVHKRSSSRPPPDRRSLDSLPLLPPTLGKLKGRGRAGASLHPHIRLLRGQPPMIFWLLAEELPPPEPTQLRPQSLEQASPAIKPAAASEKGDNTVPSSSYANGFGDKP